MMLSYVLLVIVLLAVLWVVFSVVVTNHLKKGKGPYSDIVRSICKQEDRQPYIDVDELGTYIKDGKRYLSEDDGDYAKWKDKKWCVRALLTYPDGGMTIRRYYYDTKHDAMVTVRSCERNGNEVEILLSKDDLTTPTFLIEDEGWLSDDHGNSYKPAE
jgi:hypothetical protein